jgi:hypothetical protein
VRVFLILNFIALLCHSVDFVEQKAEREREELRLTLIFSPPPVQRKERNPGNSSFKPPGNKSFYLSRCHGIVKGREEPRGK